MQKSFSKFLFVVAVILLIQSVTAQIIPGKYSSIPQFVKLTDDKITADEFTGWMSKHYLLPAGNGFKLLSTERDQLGMIHYRYQQTVNGIAIEGTMYILHTKNGIIQSMNGDLLDHLNAPVSASVNKFAAITSALNFINALEYKWQNAEADKALQENTGKQNATYYPQPELVYIAENNNLNSAKFLLVYKMDVYAVKPLSRNYVFVNAVTGSVVYTKNRIETADAPATAHTKYSGVKTITTDSYNSAYRLREAVRGNGINTYNALPSP